MDQTWSIRISIFLTSFTISVIIFFAINRMLLLVNPVPLLSYYIVIVLTTASLIAAARVVFISLSDIIRKKRVFPQEVLSFEEVQEADIEKRLELEKLELELDRQRLELAKQRLDLEKDRVNYVLEITNKMVDTLHPDIDQRQKEAIVNALIPNLLQLAEVNKFELTPQEGQSEA
jgi:hypothetical protein